MELRVVFVESPGVEDPLEGVHEEFLKSASNMMQKKFGIKLRLKTVKPVDSRDLFFRAKDSAAMNWAHQMRFEPERDVSPRALALGLDFLAGINMENLRLFIPSLGADSPDTDEEVQRRTVQNILVEAMAKKAQKIGALLPEPLDANQNSALSWMAACYEDSHAEIYITAEALLFDDLSRPHPHRILAPGPLGGTSLEIQSRGFHGGRGALVSTYWGSDPAASLIGDGLKSLDKRQRAELLGQFVLAHELGHAILKIPDFYDHPPECLMMTRPQDLDPLAGWGRLEANPGRCKECRPYIDMMLQFWKGEEARDKEEWQRASRSFERALDLAPAKLDGGTAFPSKIYLRLMDVYVAMEKIDKAIQMVNRFIESNPNNLKAQEIRTSLIGLYRESILEP